MLVPNRIKVLYPLASQQKRFIWVKAWGEEVYCQELSANFCFRFPDYCSIFQTEFAVIKVAADLLLGSVASFREVTICYDSRAVILALSSLSVILGLVNEYLTSLSMAARYFVIRLVWMPGHIGIASFTKIFI